MVPTTLMATTRLVVEALFFFVFVLFFCTTTSVVVVNGFNIAGKTALVTGASGGIGAGIAKRLAKEGANVWIHYNDRLEGAKTTRDAIGERALGLVRCDFRDNDNIHRMMKSLEEATASLANDIDSGDGNSRRGRRHHRPPPFDILVNNAGLITKSAIDDDDDNLTLWHETLQVNLHAPVLLSRLFRKSLMQSPDSASDTGEGAATTTGGRNSNGVIINVSSIHGDKSVEWMGAYATSKAALNRVSQTLANEWAADGIRVNVISPGVVPVERTERLFTDQVTDMWLQHLPLNKLGSVDEIAEATIPLITNDWVTGTIWTIDGGMMSRSNMPVRPKPPAPRGNQNGPISNEVVIDTSK